MDGNITLSFGERNVLGTNFETEASLPQVKVFNKTYVEENIFTPDKRATSIFYLGEESIEKQKEIEAHRNSILEIDKNYSKIKTEKDKQEKELTETMSLQGSCWMLTREKYWGLGICDENFGSWGSQGIEVSVKTLLSGGRVLVNHRSWYAHMFRTQGGDFGFPYHISSKDQEKAKSFARDLFFNNKCDKQTHPMSWLLEKFWPVPNWPEDKRKWTFPK